MYLFLRYGRTTLNRRAYYSVQLGIIPFPQAGHMHSLIGRLLPKENDFTLRNKFMNEAIVESKELQAESTSLRLTCSTVIRNVLEHYYLHVVLALTALIWFVAPKELTFSDPAEYLLLANDLSNILNWDMDYPFEHRLSLLSIQWLSLELFGFGALGMFLPQFLMFAGVLTVVGKSCQTLQGKTFAIVIAFAMFPYTLDIFPDLGAAVFMFFTVLLLARAQGARDGVLASVCMMIAFLFKMTAYYLAIPILLVLGIDAMRRKLNRFHFAFLLTSSGLGICYLLFYQIGYGDALARLRTASELSDGFLWSTADTVSLLRRLLFNPPSEFLSHYGVALILTIVASYYLYKSNRSNRLMIAYLLGSMFLFTFGSSSLSSWQPLPFEDRMLLFAIPAFAFLSGRFVDVLMTRRQLDSVVPLLLVCSLTFIAHDSFSDVVKKVSRPVLSSREHVRHDVIRDSNLPVILAEDRTQRFLQIYSDFNTSIEERLRVCPDLTVLQSPEKYAYLIDREQAAFLNRAYGENVCVAELEQFIADQNITVLVDNAEMLYARN